MKLHDFIFTTKVPGRYLRHLTFWVAQALFWIFWATVIFNTEAIIFRIKFDGFFIMEMVYTYCVVYFISTKYPVGSRKFFIVLFFLTLAFYIIFICYHFWFLDLFNQPRDTQLLEAWFLSMNFIIKGPPVVCALFLTIKMLKEYYIKMDEKIMLTMENAEAELQLLKAQIHPHFLFNTLNNIYSFALHKSPQASSLVQKLTDTLKYMVNDCEAPMVPLEMEIKMIMDYIGLEKVRYGKRLNIDLLLTGDYQNKLIAPLLLIPFVENCFKHGTSKTLEKPWIKLEIIVTGFEFVMNLGNSNPLQTIPGNIKNGIGLKNVQNRLSLLFPANHEIKISTDENSFSVFVKIPLGKQIADPLENIKPSVFQTSKTLSHA